jgi:hypothetical protein
MPATAAMIARRIWSRFELDFISFLARLVFKRSDYPAENAGVLTR